MEIITVITVSELTPNGELFFVGKIPVLTKYPDTAPLVSSSMAHLINPSTARLRAHAQDGLGYLIGHPENSHD